MDDTKKLLIVRVPAGDLPALEAMRDYIQASLQLGVVAVQEDTTLEVMELPPLGWMLSDDYYQAVDELFEEPSEPVAIGVATEPLPEPVVLPFGHAQQEESPESKLPDPETITFMGQGAGEKKEIYARMRRYRQAHGLGCWNAVAELAGDDVTPDLLRDIIIGAAAPPMKVWREINKALDKLESGEEETT